MCTHAHTLYPKHINTHTHTQIPRNCTKISWAALVFSQDTADCVSCLAHHQCLTHPCSTEQCAARPAAGGAQPCQPTGLASNLRLPCPHLKVLHQHSCQIRSAHATSTCWVGSHLPLGNTSRLPWPTLQRCSLTPHYRHSSPYSLTVTQTDSRYKLHLQTHYYWILSKQPKAAAAGAKTTEIVEITQLQYGHFVLFCLSDEVPKNEYLL